MVRRPEVRELIEEILVRPDHISCHLPVQVRFSLLSRQENCLQRPPTAIGLDPPFFSVLQCTSPKSHPISVQSRIGQLKHNAANILVREKIIAGELHLVEQAMCVKKERIASPAKKTAVISGLGD